MTDLYTVTFNIAKEKSNVQGNDYFSDGHIWYELQNKQDGTHRFGLFQEKFERENKENIESNSSSITIQITQEQYNKLYEFGQTPSDLGFRPSSNSFFGNSVDFVFSALRSIGYSFDFESRAINSADNAFENLVNVLAKNNAVFPEEDNSVPINERKEIILSHYRQTGVYKSPGIGSFSSKNGYSSSSNSQSSSVDAGNNSASNSKQYSNSHNQDKSSSGSASNKVKVDIFNPLPYLIEYLYQKNFMSIYNIFDILRRGGSCARPKYR